MLALWLNPVKARAYQLKTNLSRHLWSRYLFEIRDIDIGWYKKVRPEEGVKHTTINRELAVLRAILNKAKSWGFLSYDVPRMARSRWWTTPAYDIWKRLWPSG